MHPVIEGGSNDAANICITCPECNYSKRDKLPQRVEWAIVVNVACWLGAVHPKRGCSTVASRIRSIVGNGYEHPDSRYSLSRMFSPLLGRCLPGEGTMFITLVRDGALDRVWKCPLNICGHRKRHRMGGNQTTSNTHGHRLSVVSSDYAHHHSYCR